jgi:hypothetical protein
VEPRSLPCEIIQSMTVWGTGAVCCSAAHAFEFGASPSFLLFRPAIFGLTAAWFGCHSTAKLQAPIPRRISDAETDRHVPPPHFSTRVTTTSRWTMFGPSQNPTISLFASSHSVTEFIVISLPNCCSYLTKPYFPWLAMQNIVHSRFALDPTGPYT